MTAAAPSSSRNWDFSTGERELGAHLRSHLEARSLAALAGLPGSRVGHLLKLLVRKTECPGLRNAP